MLLLSGERKVLYIFFLSSCLIHIPSDSNDSHMLDPIIGVVCLSKTLNWLCFLARAIKNIYVQTFDISHQGFNILGVVYWAVFGREKFHPNEVLSFHESYGKSWTFQGESINLWVGNILIRIKDRPLKDVTAMIKWFLRQVISEVVAVSYSYHFVTEIWRTCLRIRPPV